LLSTSINDLLISRIEHCSHCGNKEVSKLTVFCPICGEPIKAKGGFPLKYKDIELTLDGKALICPICENDKVGKHGTYCKICGVNLIQKCDNPGCKSSNCDLESHLNPQVEGNARFCQTCGQPTTFFKNRLLKSWQDEKNELEISSIAF